MSLGTQHTATGAAREALEPRDEARLGRHAEPYLLLVLQQQGRSYGYELGARLEAFGFRRAARDPGVVYRVLRRLEDAQLITSEWDTAGTGPARRYYRLTDAGRVHLHESAEQLARQARRIEQFFQHYRAQVEEPARG